MQETDSSHPKSSNVTIKQGEAMHRKCKRLKLGQGQAYDLSVD
jgi:hypothetical protein